MKYLVVAISLTFLCCSAFAQTESNTTFPNDKGKPFGTTCYSFHKEKPMLIVLTDGAGQQKIFRAGRRRFKRLSTENIETITILTAENAVAQYGKKGRNGVMLITMKTT